MKGCLDAGCRGPAGSNPGVAGCRPRGRTGRSGQGGTCWRRLPSRPPAPTPGAGGPGLCLGESGGRRAPSQRRTRQAGAPKLAARRTRPRGAAGATHPPTGRGSRPRDWQREPGAAGWAPRSAGWRQSPRGARSTQPPLRYFLYFPPATAGPAPAPGPAPGPPTGKGPRAVPERRRSSSAGRWDVRSVEPPRVQRSATVGPWSLPRCHPRRSVTRSGDAGIIPIVPGLEVLSESSRAVPGRAWGW